MFAIRVSFPNLLLLLRKQEEFMNGLFLLYWDGVTDLIAVGHNKLPATAEFAPLKVGCSLEVSNRYHG